MYVGWDGCGLIHCPISDMMTWWFVASTVAVYVCVVVMMSSSLPTALPLTPEKARYVFENSSLVYLCSCLNIPDDKSNNAASASEHFTQSTKPMKGREMVFYLDWNGDTALADTVMECAEPPAGMYMFMW